jgi:hypothetical protein
MAQYESDHRVQLPTPDEGSTDLDSGWGMGFSRVLVGVGHRRNVSLLGVC